MCTVTFVNSDNKIIISSNRDEMVLRPTNPPDFYTINNKSILFPKDKKAGGTWMAVTENNEIAVLLNGAQNKHVRKNYYRRSRGLILLDIIAADFPLNYWRDINLSDIEPFTIIYYAKEILFKLLWDGTQKSQQELNYDDAHIWSSSTLYSPAIIKIRESWFDTFINKNKMLKPKQLLDFHLNTEQANRENGLMINRGEVLQTVSTTQIILDSGAAEMIYCDHLTQNHYQNSFTVNT